MIRSIIQMAPDRAHYQWCDHCKRRCNDIITPYLVKSTNNTADMCLCKACIDMALNEQGILPEEF